MTAPAAAVGLVLLLLLLLAAPLLTAAGLQGYAAAGNT
jgi:hypothetical protein